MPDPLQPEKLRRRCDPAGLAFSTTAEVEPLRGTIGQQRALDAVAFGLEIETHGYNIFATGPIGTGKRTTLEAHLRAQAAERPSPADRLYLFDFANEDRPMALSLPSGEGKGFVEGMRGFVEEVRRRIPDAFESENYQDRRRELVEEVEGRREEVLGELRGFANQRDLALELTPAGLVTIPVIEGKPVPPAEFRRLPEQVREQFTMRIEEVEDRMPAALTRLRQIERDGSERLRALDREVAQFAIGHLVDEIKDRYGEAPRVGEWLERVREDIVEHLGNFGAREAGEQNVPEPIASGMRRARQAFFARYEPNLLVGHDRGDGAPVVFETNPTYYNLFGRIEYEATFGALSTDHRHVKAGAVHRANGGYLMLDALSVLSQPFVWTKLKETLRARRVEIETIGSQLTLFPTATLEPEPIDLDLKVILVGSPALYALLHMIDEDVRKLFRVKADFDVDMPWREESPGDYASFIAGQVESDGLLHFDREAVARVVEHGSRLAEHQGKVSTRFADIADLVAESSHWAGKESEDAVRAGHVERAISEKAARSNLVEERIRELVAEGTLMIDVSGQRIGQANGLSVARVGDYQFGRPVRITASTGLGGGDVLDIDRETELSGPIHDKGFLILSGFLGERFGGERPLALRGSIVFEQSYEEIEGDSASCAELCALLSSLSGVPIRQGVAITGSVNQHGEVQAIGGVNEKIEGFHATCAQAGFGDGQGVVVPAANARHLMLREEVVESVREGRFAVWPVGGVDEAIEVLTGTEAGQRADDGSYPPGSVYGRVAERLDHLAELARRFSSGPADSRRKP
ncbi:MAG: ATP-binding protein [Solirubrobacterales bacterium]